MLRRTLKISLGIICMALGIAGIFLPIVPGILLLFIGFAFIIDRNPKLLFKEIVARARQKYNRQRTGQGA